LDNFNKGTAIEDAIRVVATDRSVALVEAHDWIWDRIAADELAAKGVCDADGKETLIQPYWFQWLVSFGSHGIWPEWRDGISYYWFDVPRAAKEEEVRLQNRQPYTEWIRRELPPHRLRSVTVNTEQIIALLRAEALGAVHGLELTFADRLGEVDQKVTPTVATLEPEPDGNKGSSEIGWASTRRWKRTAAPNPSARRYDSRRDGTARARITQEAKTAIRQGADGGSSRD